MQIKKKKKIKNFQLYHKNVKNMYIQIMFELRIDLQACKKNYLSISLGTTLVVVFSAVVDTTFVDIYVDTKNIPTCRYNIQNIDKRTMEK